MRFDLHCGIRAIPFNSIFHLLPRVIYTVLTSLDQMICPSAVEKFQAFKNIFPIKSFELLIRCCNAQKFKYCIYLIFDMILDIIVLCAFFLNRVAWG